MEKDPNKIENWKQIKDILSDADKSSDLHDALADNEETIHEKLWNLNQEYWNQINKESELDYEITEKDVKEIPLSEVENKIEKRFGKSSIEYKVFQKLKKLWLRVLINTKTDISYTYSPDWTDRYNIMRWRWPVTEQSKATMMYDNSNVSDEEVYMTKLIHEMWHSTLWYNAEHQKSKVSSILTILGQIRNEYNISLTKLWDNNRYPSIDEKVKEDCVEFIRMYMQNPIKFKEYLKSIIPAEHVINWIYSIIENFVQKLLNDNIDLEQ